MIIDFKGTDKFTQIVSPKTYSKSQAIYKLPMQAPHVSTSLGEKVPAKTLYKHI